MTLRPRDLLARSVLALVLLVVWPYTLAAATPCVLEPGRRASVALLGGGGSGFRDLGALANVGTGVFEVDAEYRARRFTDDDVDQSTFGAGVALRGDFGRFRVCPTAGFSRGTLESLTRWLVPAGVVLAAPVAVSDAVTFTPFVEPGLVWSRATFADQRRRSLDPALEVGAAVSARRFHVGASWGRQFLDGVPSGWSAFLGVSLPVR